MSGQLALRKDARREERENRRLQVNFHQIDEERPHIGFTTNVSERGLFVTTSHLKERGTVLYLYIGVPLGTIRLKVVVAWTRWIPVHLRQAIRMGFGVKVVEGPAGWTELLS